MSVWRENGPRSATVTLNSADLLALYTTPKVLVPAVAGALVLPIACLLNYVYGGTAYVDGGGNLVLELGNGLVTWASHASAGFWDQAANELMILNPFAGEPLLHASAAWLGQPLQLGQSAASPTVGNGTIKATVAYIVVSAL